jgi:hypothetical protein
MKKFKQKQVSISKTQMKNKIINFDQVEKIRVAIYSNAHSMEKPHVAEVDFHFTEKQSEWEDQTVVKLRNDLYKLNNIGYKVPADFKDAQPFYDMAVQEARKFKRRTNSDLHNKLGKRYPDRYYTIPFTYLSYDPVTESGILQITDPLVLPCGTIDFTTNYQSIDYELDKEGRGMKYTWIGEDD